MNLFLSLFLAFFIACGGGEDQQQTQPGSSEDDQPAMKQEVRTIKLIGVDQMKFAVSKAQEGVYTSDTLTGSGGNEFYVVDSISVSPGEKLKVVLENKSSLPPSSMSHNFVLLEMGTDAESFASASANAKKNEYISPDHEDAVLAKTKMIGGDTTDSVTFTVPEKTGKYDYICTFPGHYAAGMEGKLIVE